MWISSWKKVPFIFLPQKLPAWKLWHHHISLDTALMVARNSISLYKQNNGVDWFGSDKSLRHFQESDRHHEKRNNQIRWIFSLPQNQYSWVYLGWRLNSASDTISNFENSMANRPTVGHCPMDRAQLKKRPVKSSPDSRDLKHSWVTTKNWNFTFCLIRIGII